MSVRSALQKINQELEGSSARLVAVSKTFPSSAIWEAYDADQRIFGESKAQELAEKYASLPKDIEWHFIGHLQTNKVKYIAPFIKLIHSVDSFKLLQAIDKEAAKNERVIDVLLQVHIAQEEAKFGLDESEILAIFADPVYKALNNVRVCGLMGMATNSTDVRLLDKEFLSLADLFSRLKHNIFSHSKGQHFTELSMGMSNDYPLGVKRGATLVRIGSRIFGGRVYAAETKAEN